MHRSGISTFLWVIFLPFFVHAKIYEGAANIVHVTYENFDEVVLNTHETVVLQFCRNENIACDRFLPVFLEAADAMKGIAKFAYVDVDLYEDVKKRYRVLTTYPLIKIITGDLAPDKDGKPDRKAHEYEGPNTARYLQDEIGRLMANNVKTVLSVDDFDDLRHARTGALGIMLSFSSKDLATPLYKALSQEYRNRIYLAHIPSHADPALAEKYGIKKRPSLVYIPSMKSGETTPIHYKGGKERREIVEFIQQFVLPEEVAGQDPVLGKKKKRISAPVIELSPTRFESDVLGMEESWIVMYHKGEEWVPGFENLTKAAQGYAHLGAVDCTKPDHDSFCDSQEIENPVLRIYEYSESKRANKFKETVDWKEAKKIAMDSLPDTLARIDEFNLDSVMSTAVGTVPSKSLAIFFSEKSDPTPLARALALEYRGRLLFAHAGPKGGGKNLMARFSVEDLPFLLILHPHVPEGKTMSDVLQAGGEVAFQGLPYTWATYTFPDMKRFMDAFIDRLDPTNGFRTARPQQNAAPADGI